MIPASKKIKISATVGSVVALALFMSSAPSFAQLTGSVRVSTVSNTVKRRSTDIDQPVVQTDPDQRAQKPVEGKKKPRKSIAAHGNQFPFQVTVE